MKRRKVSREGENPEAEPLLIVLSGPSGVGKDAVLAKMRAQRRPLYYAVTATTRPQRKGESEGGDYHFLSRAEFEEMLQKGEFLEWAKVYGNLYGVPKRQIREALAKGLDVIMKVDVQGAATIKSLMPDAVFIFLTPPSLKELEKRLRERKSESAKELKLRVETARREMECLPMFDHVVTNPQGQVELTVAKINAIIDAERYRAKGRRVKL